MKIIKIDRCLDCPHHHIIHTVRFTSAVTLGCKKEWRRIEDDSSIPDWCPLEDAIPTSAMHSDGEGRCTCEVVHGHRMLYKNCPIHGINRRR